MLKLFPFAIVLCLFCCCFPLDVKGFNYVLVQNNDEKSVYLDKESVQCNKWICMCTIKIEFSDKGKSTAVSMGLKPETNYLQITELVDCENASISHLSSLECISEKDCKFIYNPHADDLEACTILDRSNLDGLIYSFVCTR